MSERATEREMRQWLELETWLRAMSGLVETERRRASWGYRRRIDPLVKLLDEAVHRASVLAEGAAWDVEQSARGVCEDCGAEGDPERLHDHAGADRCADCCEDYDEALREDAAERRAEYRDEVRRSEAALPWGEFA